MSNVGVVSRGLQLNLRTVGVNVHIHAHVYIGSLKEQSHQILYYILGSGKLN
jgi:hypothetical protein